VRKKRKSPLAACPSGLLHVHADSAAKCQKGKSHSHSTCRTCMHMLTQSADTPQPT
jgi:hypothetical protein